MNPFYSNYVRNIPYSKINSLFEKGCISQAHLQYAANVHDSRTGKVAKCFIMTMHARGQNACNIGGEVKVKEDAEGPPDASVIATILREKQEEIGTVIDSPELNALLEDPESICWTIKNTPNNKFGVLVTVWDNRQYDSFDLQQKFHEQKRSGIISTSHADIVAIKVQDFKDKIDMQDDPPAAREHPEFSVWGDANDPMRKVPVRSFGVPSIRHAIHEQSLGVDYKLNVISEN